MTVIIASSSSNETVKRITDVQCSAYRYLYSGYLKLSYVTHSRLIVQSYELQVWTGLASCDPVPASPREMCNTDPRDCSPVSNCCFYP